ncbi:MerR family transcriptional regulator [Frankia sp. CNm7]|uniref:MerR family transcriptional regulator n=1 Tax=Frankia nepalensis TaxID=1836974 RepID=A0A937RJD6_9ACTN|nr:MerR family transcriptional regulator [Frankia nepalensis]MBL7502173.1 MerR family transcriptional regulator [Frankia nepalensis]MBL7510561.1 MerR family transcriptional regulator [Frankia nepalensis]MBL7518287.1 MerR family transcriptional regulator [Frankia nepalensis]MBL7633348.1 MerR family transcriptional regulator [Frankia nepalensis]
MTGGPSLPRSGEPLAGTPRAARGSGRQGQRRAGSARRALTTERQIAYWRRSGLLRPGPTELAQARTIAALRRAGVSLTRIRAAADRLQASWAAVDPTYDPLSSAASPSPRGPASLSDGLASRTAGPSRLAVLGAELFIQHPDGTWEGDSQPGQLVLDGVLPLPGPPSSGPDRSERRPGTASTRRRAPGPDREAILQFLAREDALTPARPGNADHQPEREAADQRRRAQSSSPSQRIAARPAHPDSG